MVRIAVGVWLTTDTAAMAANLAGEAPAPTLTAAGPSAAPPALRVYIDPTTRDYTLPFDDFRPVRPATESSPDLSAIASILFVVDANHTKPGASGRLWLKRAVLER